jgi:hypothetical protein
MDANARGILSQSVRNVQLEVRYSYIVVQPRHDNMQENSRIFYSC